MHQLISKKFKIIVYILLIFILSNISNLKFVYFSDNFFNLKKINIIGIDNNLKKNVQKKLNVLLGNNLFFLDKNKILNIIERINYIDNYQVSKIYPSEINIVLEKTKFISSTFIDGKKFLIGQNGKLVQAETHVNKNSIPVAYGNFKVFQLINLLDLMKKINFDTKQITELYFFETNRWDFVINNSILVKLPPSNLENSLKIVTGILDKSKKNKIIDLRVSNQVIINNEG